MTSLASAIDTLSHSLQAQYQSIFQHAGDVGHSRESAVINFLRKVCPEGLGFSRGEMFDGDGRTSGEIDVIVYDKVFCTVFHDGSGKILAPIESTFGAIEVKSALTTTQLDDCLQKVSRYQAMNRPQPPAGALQILPHQAINLGAGLVKQTPESNRPTFGVVAFKNSVALETILARMSESDLLDYIVVPGEFIALNNRALDYVQLGGVSRNFVARTPSAVTLWVLTLQTQVHKARLVGTNKAPAFLSLLSAADILS